VTVINTVGHPRSIGSVAEIQSRQCETQADRRPITDALMMTLNQIHSQAHSVVSQCHSQPVDYVTECVQETFVVYRISSTGVKREEHELCVK